MGRVQIVLRAGGGSGTWGNLDPGLIGTFAARRQARGGASSLATRVLNAASKGPTASLARLGRTVTINIDPRLDASGRISERCSSLGAM